MMGSCADCGSSPAIRRYIPEGSDGGFGLPASARDLCEDCAVEIGVGFEEVLARFVAAVHARHVADMREHYPNVGIGRHYADPRGRKYVRIVEEDEGAAGRRVYCFVERATGNILKAESWKKPHPRPRGNIFAADPLAGTTEYGAEYIR